MNHVMIGSRSTLIPTFLRVKKHETSYGVYKCSNSEMFSKLRLNDFLCE